MNKYDYVIPVSQGVFRLCLKVTCENVLYKDLIQVERNVRSGWIKNILKSIPRNV